MFKISLLVALLVSTSIASAQAPKTTQSAKPQASIQDNSQVASASKAILSKPSTITIERYEGRSVQTNLGYNITLNKHSSLRREWFVVRDENAPLIIDGPTGVNVDYKSGERYTSGQYQYVVDYQVKPTEEIRAFEVRVLVLDVFGKLVRTLSTTELNDFSHGASFQGIWRIWSENEASEAFASVAYVAQVRTASGRVYEADKAAVFDQVRKVARRITEADLEPKRDVPQQQK